jgi:hypothetical protein
MQVDRRAARCREKKSDALPRRAFARVRRELEQQPSYVIARSGTVVQDPRDHVKALSTMSRRKVQHAIVRVTCRFWQSLEYFVNYGMAPTDRCPGRHTQYIPAVFLSGPQLPC